MKRLISILLLCLTMLSVNVFAANKVEPPDACVHCGMNRTTFAYSRMLITYADGASSGTCSLHCIATDLQHAKGKTAKSIQVADYNSKALIDAKTAVWVIGGKKQGIMTPVAKWAFADKGSAEKFVKEYGGNLADFTSALKEAEKELAANDPAPTGKKHMGH
jgi:nitrous oxide reductase accessory protein NosL